MSASVKQKENYDFFQQILPNLLADPLMIEKYAVVHGLSVKGIFDTFETAYREACSKYSTDFIVQQIIEERKIVNFLSPAVAL